MTLNPNSSTVPDQTWQGPTLETLSLQGAGHPFEFSPQTSPFLAGQGSASQGVAVQYPQGNPNYQFSSRSGSQYIGNSQLNAKVSPVEWNTSIPSALSTGQSDRTNTSASHNRRHRKSSTGGCSNAFVTQCVMLKPNRSSWAWPFQDEHLGWR